MLLDFNALLRMPVRNLIMGTLSVVYLFVDSLSEGMKIH